LNLPLNTTIKNHTIIASIISIWLVFFLVVIAPFDTSDLSFKIRLLILPFYGVLSFGAYMLLTPIQNRIYNYYKKWNLGFEALFLIIYNIVLILFCFGYYKTNIINGTYPFIRFSSEVYLPICLIILPFIIFLRWFFNRKATPVSEDKIIITGDNKLDILKVLPSELICVSSADNYVEVSYLNQDSLKKKLLRMTLKRIQNEIPFLLKVHRSHLINPSHFKSWKDANTIILTQLEIPVSKNYKPAILELNQSSQKANTLSQT